MQLLGGFSGYNNMTGEAVRIQILKTAGLILVGVRQIEVFRTADLLSGQVRELVAYIAALIAAVYDKGYMASFNVVAMALLCTGLSCQIELHEYLLCGFAGMQNT